MVVRVVGGEAHAAYLGVQLPDVAAMESEAIEGRLAELRALVPSVRGVTWLLQGVTTEMAMLEAVLIHRSHQLPIEAVDLILPPMDGVAAVPIAATWSASTSTGTG